MTPQDLIRLLDVQTKLLKKLAALEEINEMLVGVVNWVKEYVDAEKGLAASVSTAVQDLQAACSQLVKTSGVFN